MLHNIKAVIYIDQANPKLQECLIMARMLATLYKLNLVPLRKHFIHDGVRMLLEPM